MIQPTVLRVALLLIAAQGLAGCGIHYTGWVNDRYPPHGEMVELSDGLKLHVVEEGTSGPTVVLVHGNPGFTEDFARVQELAREEFRTIAFDRPGHGHSSRPAETTIDEQIDWLRELLMSRDALPKRRSLAEPIYEGYRVPTAERANQLILVGFSWGGAFALLYANKYPSDVSGLVLIGSYGFADESLIDERPRAYTWPIIGPVFVDNVGVLFADKLARNELRKAFQPGEVPADLEEYVREASYVHTRPDAIRAMVQDEDQVHEALHELWASKPRFEMPVIIIASSKDSLVPADGHSDKLHDSSDLPRSFRCDAIDQGHMIPQKDPGLVVSMLRFLRDWKAEGELPDMTKYGLEPRK